MANPYFHHKLLQKYVALFGTLFNDIHIERDQSAQQTSTQRIKVPIAYGPRQKYLARQQQDPDNSKLIAIQLPRMSFELVGFSYDRGTGRGRHVNLPSGISANTQITHMNSRVPWLLNFQLSILVGNTNDGLKITEQILPNFDPTWTLKAFLVDEFPDLSLDIPISIEGMSMEDLYEGDFETRRMQIVTIDFAMQTYFFGPSKKVEVIKIADVDIYTKYPMDTILEGITVQPGLTSNGQPTTDITQTISHLDIKSTDDYGIIETVRNDKRT